MQGLHTSCREAEHLCFLCFKATDLPTAYICCVHEHSGNRSVRPVHGEEELIFIPGLQDSEQAELLRACSDGLTFVCSFVSSHISQALSVDCAAQKDA